ncbi:MAG TPA: DegV family protein [Actinomycetes bacterium]|nr:DegV family protein [Actinomycetes bacterium]
MSVAVVTDGAASLPPDLAAANGVTVVPLEATMAGRTEARLTTLEELVPHIGDGVRTAGPPSGRFAAAIGDCQHGDGVLVLTVARSVSSIYQAATLGARRAPGPVRVADTGTAAGAQGLVVLAAARAARAGLALEAVEAAARRAAAAVRLVATLETLEYLVKGGRLPKVIGHTGGRLGVRPLLEFRAGTIRPLRPALSRAAARRRILARWRASRPPGAALHVAALHALAPDEASDLLQDVLEEVEPATAFVAEFGAAMVAHTGPGLVGLAWWWERTGA